MILRFYTIEKGVLNIRFKFYNIELTEGKKEFN